MDRKLRKILTECIRDIETGARDVEGCLQRHRDRAAELRPHLELWSGLNAAAKAQPNLGSQQRGQQKMMAALAEVEKRGEKRMIPFLTPALAKAAAVVAAAALLIGGAAGTSAALGGPDVADEVLTTVGITSDHDGTPAAAEDGLDTAARGEQNSDGPPPAAEDGRETAARGEQNSDGPPPAAEDGLDTAESARDSSPDGLDNASEAERAQEQTQEQTQAQTQEQTQAQTQEQTQAQTQDKEQTQAQTQDKAREGALEGPGNGE